jgi:uncharacterized repeat protein (TIGR01451 family)
MRSPRLAHFVALTALALLAGAGAAAPWAGPPAAAQPPSQPPDGRSYPPDTTVVTRPAIRGDVITAPPSGPTHNLVIPTANPIVRNVVISNTDPTLAMTDTAPDGETSIAINPANPNEIVVSAFAGSWGANAPIYHSIDGGNTWTRRLTIPQPPGVGAAGCPCDQTFDFGRGRRLSGTFLANSNIFTGTTTNPANAASWQWPMTGMMAATANTTSIGNADQPWLLVQRDPANAAQDNVYTAYDGFGATPVQMRVAVAQGTNPPTTAIDNRVGDRGADSSCCINPGFRLATDPRNGAVYAIYQRDNTGVGAGNSHIVTYMLNRSLDGGATWGINGMGDGIQIAQVDSDQGCIPGAMPVCSQNYKMGAVNALLGGVDHGAVDPTNGDVYYVYGQRDPMDGSNRLMVTRLTTNPMTNVMTIGATTTLTAGTVQAALPSVAVNTAGTVGVTYHTFDGNGAGGFPQFTAHFAYSLNQGATWTDITLLTFLSAALPNAMQPRQRVLGDYHQMKAVGTTFYGAFTANRAAFGNPTANMDPVFFKVPPVESAGPPALTLTGQAIPSPQVVVGTNFEYRFTLTNTGMTSSTGTTISVTLPSGLSPVTPNMSFSGNPADGSSAGCQVTLNGQKVTCNIGTVDPGGTVLLTIGVRAGRPPGTALCANAQVNGGPPGQTTTRLASACTTVRAP